jgi:hypothetical protein
VRLFDETDRIYGSEDYDLWLRLCLAGARLVGVPRVGAFYRNTPGSMSKNSFRMLLTRCEVLLRAHGMIIRRPDLLPELGQTLLAVALRLLRRCLVQGAEKEVIRALTACIHELRLAGVTSKMGLHRRCFQAAFGPALAERAAVTYFRFFNKGLHQYYCRGYY